MHLLEGMPAEWLGPLSLGDLPLDRHVKIGIRLAHAENVSLRCLKTSGLTRLVIGFEVVGRSFRVETNFSSRSAACRLPLPRATARYWVILSQAAAYP